MKNVIRRNFTLLSSSLKIVFQDIIICPLEATYLVWIDLSKYFKTFANYNQFIESLDFIVNQGRAFGKKYEFCLRVNIATMDTYPPNQAELVYFAQHYLN